MTQHAPDPVTFYKCLADDLRLSTLLLIIAEQELCVCELMAALNEDSQPKVSRHLAQLRKAGILADRKTRQWVFYSINPDLPQWMKEVLRTTAQHASEVVTEHRNRLAGMGDRPERVAVCCN